MASDKSINSSEIEKNRLSDYLLNSFFNQFIENFSILLLCKWRGICESSFFDQERVFGKTRVVPSSR